MVKSVTLRADGRAIVAPFGGFVTPAANQQLSEADFTECLRICDEIEALRADAADYIADKELDPAIFNPAHIWDNRSLPSNYRAITSRSYDIVNHLRLFCYNFTGFRLADMKFAEGTEPLTQVPSNLSETLNSLEKDVPRIAFEFLRSIEHMPPYAVASPPRIFTEIGWDLGGIVVNYDTWATQQRLNALHSAGVIDHLRSISEERGHCRIVEIGAGYGGLAYALKQAIPGLRYTIIDLPQSLVFSAIYLRVVLPRENQTIVKPASSDEIDSWNTAFICNQLVDEYLDRLGPVDMALNTLSLTEMSPAQVDYYANVVQHLIADTGYFVEQNYVVEGIHTDAKQVLAEKFPYKRRVEDTIVDFSGRGDVDIWANKYIGAVFDKSDNLARAAIQYSNR